MSVARLALLGAVCCLGPAAGSVAAQTELTLEFGGSQVGPAADFDTEDVAEIKAFLEWLADNRFTLLGYREYDFRGEGGQDDIQRLPGYGCRKRSDLLLRRDGRRSGRE